MYETSKSDLQTRIAETMRKVEEIPPGDRDAFLALSHGFAQARQDTDISVAFIMTRLNEPSSFLDVPYLLNRENLLTFRPSKYSDLCREMMDLLHERARVDVQNFKDVPAHIRHHFKEDRAAQAYEGLRNRTLLIIDGHVRQ